MIIICPCVWGTQTSRARARRWIGWPSQTSWATWFCTGRTSLWWNTCPSFPSHFTSCLPTRTCPASAIPTASTRYDSPTHTCAAVRRKSDKRRRTRFCFFVFFKASLLISHYCVPSRPPPGSSAARTLCPPCWPTPQQASERGSVSSAWPSISSHCFSTSSVPNYGPYVKAYIVTVVHACMFSPNSKTVQNVQNAMMMMPFFFFF